MRTQSITIYFILSTILSVISSCSPTINKLTAADVGIALDFVRQSTTLNGKQLYVFFGDLWIVNNNDGINNLRFSDADLQINNEEIPKTYFTESNFRFRKEYYLSTGDTLCLVLQHQLIGKIMDTITVPPSIDKTNLDSLGIEHILQGDTNNLQVIWESGDCEYYRFTITSFDSNGLEIQQYSDNTQDTSMRITNYLLELASDGPFKYLAISVDPYNGKESMAGFSSYRYTIASEHGVYVSNLK